MSLFSAYSKGTALILTAFLFLSFSTSCGGIPPTYFYRVDYEIMEDESNHRDVVPVTLAIAPFKSDILYESDKIVYRNSRYEVQFYNYRRWIVPPKKLVTEKLYKHYRATGNFERVVRTPSTFPVDYILQGRIHAFEEWDEKDTWYGFVKLEFELRHAKTNEIVWEKVLSRRTTAKQKDPVSVVEAISESLNFVINRSIQGVQIHLVSHRAESR